MNMFERGDRIVAQKLRHRLPVRWRHARPLVAVLRSGFQDFASDELLSEPV
jgi:isoleucyl-tRNA synthetase